ncbi:lymphoid-specific helicase-like [Frieseomelitta varia]|uniref:lymphoid-specific helicase-like n=1 Tax=Frieseomelitta varia TaxID=561572 RepID=UPI001CB6AB5A|nr:lymphoid-specific helicase-like [Frieseomelitta varia]XP_043525886.1 lymphoid-specific helicase-like [Frieseomelitta varia]
MENKDCDVKVLISSDTSSVTDNSKSIVDNVKFNNEPLEKITVITRKKRKREDDESKRLAEEKYNQENQEQQYKRLMHLLHKSKFYSSYIVSKIDKSFNNEVNKYNRTTKRNTKEAEYADENISPQDKTKKNKKNIEEYLSEDIQKKIHASKNKLNLSDEKIKNDLEDDPENETKNTVETSKYFIGELRDYQKEGLQWLKILYENGINGILADEMGLGKTIQVIALLCHLIEKQQDGPYLLIAPLSTLSNWMSEFKKFAPKLPFVLFHGTPEERFRLKYKIRRKYEITETYSTFPIVLTSFETPLLESSFLRSFTWRYIIIDEGHRIKNHNCQLVKILKICKSMNRLLLTGTPLQNNLAELWSLLNFLLPEIFDDLAVFESWFNAKDHQGDEATKKFLKLEEEKRILSILREILQPFLLRREKSDVCLDIPPKKELIVYAPLTELQHNLYKTILNHDIDQLNNIGQDLITYTEDGKRPKRKSVLRNMDNVMNTRRDSETYKNKKFENENLLMWEKYTDVTDLNRDFLIKIRSRHVSLYKKIVNHPYLIHHPLGLDLLPKIDEELVRSSGKLLVLDAMLARLKQQGHKVLLFSTMTTILDIIEDYLSLRDYKYVRLDGKFKFLEREENIHNFNTNSEIFLFLISIRAGGVGLNLVGADTVIIYDSDWNPQVDIQAMARCHRIGQTRPVMIYKLCTKGTIDEAILNVAEAKRLLEKVVISKHVQSVNVNNKFDLLKLQELLESKTCQVASENEVFTEEELNNLLDRSELYKKQGES